MPVADPSIAPAAKPARTCKWTLGAEISRARLLVGLDALLEVDLKRPDLQIDYYRVSLVRDGDRLVGLRVVREVTGEEGEHEAVSYDVDCSFGPDATRNWTCTCGDYQYRAARRAREGKAPGCKHCLALGAALQNVGIEA